jgi:glycosyltransferase involved in cell wall biosynthesis
MIRPGKGVHVFIQAAGEILKHFSDVAFLVVGEAQFDKDYEYKDQVLNLVRQLGVTKKVKFLGFRVDVGDILAAADCLVHCPTEDDALPTVVLEAMALQTPVVGSIIGGIPEQIEDNVTGFLIEPGDSKGVANAVMQILEIPEKALCLGRSGRQKFEKEFSHQQFVQKFETIYTGLLP